MPKKTTPRYSLHKSTGQARVRINGKDHYLGQYGSPESRTLYETMIAEWLRTNGDLSRLSLTVGDLVLLYFEHAKTHYQKNGKPTSELSCVQIALRHLATVARDMKAQDFGPTAYKKVRDSMIEADYARKSINVHMGRIKRMFKWAVANEYIDISIHQRLCTVQGLQRDRSAAKESAPVKPVPQEDIDAVLPFLSEPLAAVVQIQMLTGARPGEILSMRASEIDTSGDVWSYKPSAHKTEHHGRERVISLGPKAQKLLKPFLARNPTGSLFRPDQAIEAFHAERRKNRKTPFTPSQSARAKKSKSEKKPGQQYTTSSYNQAIRKACEKAKVTRWRPNQLRHNVGTAIRRAHGVEAARTVLGHSSAVTTEIYAEMDQARAREIIKEIG